jgi:hypothetical protein
MGDTLFFKAINKYVVNNKIQYSFTNMETFKNSIEEVWGKPIDNFLKIWYQGKEIPEIKIKWFQNSTNKLAIKIQFISNQNNEVFWAMKLPFRLSKYIEGGVRKDTLIFLDFNENNQTFEIELNQRIDILYFDPDCWFLVKKVVQLTPEAGFNDNSSLYFFPNPSADYLYFNQNKYNFTSLKFYDILGRLIYETNENTQFINSDFSNTIGKLDIRFLQNGYYDVVITSKQNGVFHQKLIKIEN